MNQSQAVSVQEALRMCTYNGYYVTFDEKERGSLEAGKIADMVVLSDDLYSVDKKDPVMYMEHQNRTKQLFHSH